MATSMPLCAVIIGLFSEFKIRERREFALVAGSATACGCGWWGAFCFPHIVAYGANAGL